MCTCRCKSVITLLTGVSCMVKFCSCPCSGVSLTPVMGSGSLYSSLNLGKLAHVYCINSNCRLIPVLKQRNSRPTSPLGVKLVGLPSYGSPYILARRIIRWRFVSRQDSFLPSSSKLSLAP